MKVLLLTAWKWIVAALILFALGLFLVLGIGNKHGTRLNRLRLNLWRCLIALTAGGGLFLASMSSGCNTKKEKPQTREIESTGAKGVETTIEATPGSVEITEEETEPVKEEEPAQEVAHKDETAPEEGDPPGDRPKKKKKKIKKIKKTCYKPMLNNDL